LESAGKSPDISQVLQPIPRAVPRTGDLIFRNWNLGWEAVNPNNFQFSIQALDPY
jgi:hypothetical protein